MMQAKAIRKAEVEAAKAAQRQEQKAKRDLQGKQIAERASKLA